jgi:hypothetical protein
MSGFDEQRISELLRLLPPAPVGWVRTAQELPFVAHDLDAIVARAEADASFRDRLLADLEQALVAEGYACDPTLVEAVRRRLHTD